MPTEDELRPEMFLRNNLRLKFNWEKIFRKYETMPESGAVVSFFLISVLSIIVFRSISCMGRWKLWEELTRKLPEKHVRPFTEWTRISGLFAFLLTEFYVFPDWLLYLLRETVPMPWIRTNLFGISVEKETNNSTKFWKWRRSNLHHKTLQLANAKYGK